MNPFAPALRALRRRLRTEERGFTLVELLVAQGIILVSLLSLAYTATVGFSDIALARQRDGANGLANRLIEQVRALPFDVVRRGLSNNDSLDVDPAIEPSGCATPPCYRASSDGIFESIPTWGTPGGENPQVEPINPHEATTTIGNTAYTRFVYITYYNDDHTLDAFRVTSVVSWAPPQRGGVRITVQAQTVLYSPPGCTSTATHPFASPCQPFLYANAERLQGSFTLSGSVQNVPFESATLFTTAQSSTMQIEQIAAVQSRAVSSGVRSVRPGHPTEELIPLQASASADNDPSQPGAEYQSTNLGPTSGSCCSEASGNQNFVQVVASTGDRGTTIATTRAGGTNTCRTQSDGLPCGEATASQGTGERITLHIQRGNAADLGLTDIAVISPAGTATEAAVDRTLPSGVDGSVTAEVRRRIGEVRLGALPSKTTETNPPPGWNTGIGLIRLSGYADSASAAAGSGTTGPVASITAGTVQYWNPATSTYTTLDLASAPSAPTEIAIPNFQFSTTIGNQNVRVEYADILFKAGGSTTSSETLTGAARSRAEAHVLSPLTGSFRQRIFLQGTLMADLLFTVDFLQTNATAQYVPAPGGTP